MPLTPNQVACGRSCFYSLPCRPRNRFVWTTHQCAGRTARSDTMLCKRRSAQLSLRSVTAIMGRSICDLEKADSKNKARDSLIMATPDWHVDSNGAEKVCLKAAGLACLLFWEPLLST